MKGLVGALSVEWEGQSSADSVCLSIALDEGGA